MKMGKKIIKFDHTKIKEYEFHQYKTPILMNDIDIKYFIVTKIINKLDLYAHYFQKWVYIKDILIRLSVCIYDKRWINFW